MGEIVSGERRLNTNALGLRAARAATGLDGIGVKRGDIIALFLRNDFPFFEASMAAGILGVYPTPVNWHATPEEARYILENSGAKAIVIHSDMYAGIKHVVPAGVRVFVVQTPAEIAAAYGVTLAPIVPEGTRDWSSWLEGFAPWSGELRANPGTIIYTSGTTGNPKGVRRAANTGAGRKHYARPPVDFRPDDARAGQDRQRDGRPDVSLGAQRRGVARAGRGRHRDRHGQLFDGDNRERALQVLDMLTDKAERHLRGALKYVKALPWWQHGIRLGCIFPLMFAIRTLAVCRRNAQVFKSEAKSTRADVKKIVVDATLWGWSNLSLDRYYQELNTVEG